MTKVLWSAWILGVVLVIASWGELVDPVVGWIGFSLATAAAVVSLFAAQARKVRLMPEQSERAERLWQEHERQLDIGRKQQEEAQRQQEIARRQAVLSDAHYERAQQQYDRSQQQLDRRSTLLDLEEENCRRIGALLDRFEKLADRLSAALDRLEEPNKE